MLRSIAIGVLVMVDGISALPQPFPSKESNPEEKYSLTFKDGLSYANYAGAVQSVALLISTAISDINKANNTSDCGKWLQLNTATAVLLLSAATLNIFSAKIESEKDSKKSKVLSAVNFIWSIGNLVMICFGLSTNEYGWAMHCAIKGSINIANAVYRASFINNKK